MGGEFKCKIPAVLSNKREERKWHMLQCIPMIAKRFWKKSEAYLRLSTVTIYTCRLNYYMYICTEISFYAFLCSCLIWTHKSVWDAWAGTEAIWSQYQEIVFPKNWPPNVSILMQRGPNSNLCLSMGRFSLV